MEPGSTIKIVVDRCLLGINPESYARRDDLVLMLTIAPSTPDPYDGASLVGYGVHEGKVKLIVLWTSEFKEIACHSSKR